MIHESHAMQGEEVSESVVFSTVADIHSNRGVQIYQEGQFDVITDEEFFTIIQGDAMLLVEGAPTIHLEAGMTGSVRGGEKATLTVMSSNMIKTYQNFQDADTSTATYAVLSAINVPLEDEPMEPGKSWKQEGSNPDVSSTILAEYHNGRILCGIWRCTTGAVTYVEEDEIFTVIQGKATIRIENGKTMELSAGMCGEFKKGDVAQFCVHETFLKTFQITL